MGRAPCCDKANVKRGPWSPDEDDTLRNYLQKHGTGGNWIALPRKAGLKRCGKSCRLRWLNYLRPDIKHGGFTDEEDNIIYSLYNTIGSRWSIIAAQLPGRTDNDIKNHWNTKLKKKILAAPKNNEIITITDSSTSSVPVETEVSSSYMTDNMKYYQQDYYDVPGLVLEQHGQFPPFGVMDYNSTMTTTANNNYSSTTMPSSQEGSTFFPLENNSSAWFIDGAGTEDQGFLLDQLDFDQAPDHPHYLFTASSQM